MVLSSFTHPHVLKGFFKNHNNGSPYNYVLKKYGCLSVFSFLTRGHYQLLLYGKGLCKDNLKMHIFNSTKHLNCLNDMGMKKNRAEFPSF